MPGRPREPGYGFVKLSDQRSELARSSPVKMGRSPLRRECWNDGKMECREWLIVHGTMIWNATAFRENRFHFFKPILPFFRYSIIPCGHATAQAQQKEQSLGPRKNI
jgi:hypothetical protein